jgi:toxin ParE1/3/4
LEDLQSIQDFIALPDPKAAEKVIEPLFAAFESLPQRTPPAPDLTKRNVRFWAVGSYLVVYRVTRGSLQVAAILHGARDVLRILEMR